LIAVMILRCHDGAEHRADVDQHRAAGEHLPEAERHAHDQHERDRHAGHLLLGERLPHHVVDYPRHDESAQADARGRAGAQAALLRNRLAAHVVHDAEQQNSGDEGVRGAPAEPI